MVFSQFRVCYSQKLTMKRERKKSYIIAKKKKSIRNDKLSNCCVAFNRANRAHSLVCARRTNSVYLCLWTWTQHNYRMYRMCIYAHRNACIQLHRCRVCVRALICDKVALLMQVNVSRPVSLFAYLVSLKHTYNVYYMYAMHTYGHSHAGINNIHHTHAIQMFRAKV